MNQTFAIGISFLAATLAVFGALYLVDQSFNVKASKSQYPMREIKGSVGAVSPIEKPEVLAPPTGPATAGDPASSKKRKHVDTDQ